MTDIARSVNRGQFRPGQSGNRGGRPKAAESASEINRALMKRYGSWDRLARIAAGLCAFTEEEQKERIAAGRPAYPEPTISEQLNALKLQAAYGYGQPTQTVESIGALLDRATGITVNLQYVDKQIVQNIQPAAAAVAPGPGESPEGVAAVQLLPDGPAVGQVDAGAGSDRADGG